MDRRYGGAWADRLASMFEREGLPFDREIQRVPRSFDALRLAELARERRLHPALHQRLMDAFWVRGRNLGDHDVLDPWGNRWQLVDYREIQFTKAPGVLAGMGLGHLEKSERALAELRQKGLA